jgi:hypothetical protein
MRAKGSSEEEPRASELRAEAKLYREWATTPAVGTMDSVSGEVLIFAQLVVKPSFHYARRQFTQLFPELNLGHGLGGNNARRLLINKETDV